MILWICVRLIHGSLWVDLSGWLGSRTGGVRWALFCPIRSLLLQAAWTYSHCDYGVLREEAKMCCCFFKPLLLSSLLAYYWPRKVIWMSQMSGKWGLCWQRNNRTSGHGYRKDSPGLSFSSIFYTLQNTTIPCNLRVVAFPPKWRHCSHFSYPSACLGWCIGLKTY